MLIAKTQPIQSIEEHSNRLIAGLNKIIKIYKDKFNKEETELIQLVSEYHDKGKSNLIMQDKFYKILKLELPNRDKDLYNKTMKMYNSIVDGEYIPHGFLSPAFLNLKEIKDKYGIEFMRIIINAIYHHHNRDREYSKNDLRKIIEEDLMTRFPNEYMQYDYVRHVYVKDKDLTNEEWVKYAIIKGMLNKLDYWASSTKDIEIEINPFQNGKNLGEIIEEKITSDGFKLREIQEYMKDHSDDNLVVVGSTGIGKSEAAMLWAKSEKTFYALPLQVSINSMYKRFKEKYNYGEDKITLLHANALSYLLKNESHNSFEKYTLTRNLSFPLTICTIDQLISYIYKYNGCEMIFASLKYSKLIIDEIQAYTPEVIGKLIYALKLLNLAGGKFAIIEHYMKINDIKYEKPSKAYLSPYKNRHFIDYVKGDFDYNEIIQEGKNKKVLVICNKVKKARQVYEKLKQRGEKVEIKVLHSAFIKKHRDILEKNIMEFAENKDTTGIWICTQIVEASLDIDFDMLYTEMCTADALLQRLGRCYRARIYTGKTPNVKIHDNKYNENGKKEFMIYDEFLYDRSVEYLKKFLGKIFTEEEKIEYINKVYNAQDLKIGEFANKINSAIKECEDMLPFYLSKEEAQKKIREITSVSLIPISTYNKINANGDFDSLISKSIDKSLGYIERIKAENKIKEYVVTVSHDISDNHKERIDGTDMFITDYEYEFDEATMTGRGLIR